MSSSYFYKGYITSPHPNNVRFTFPNGRELWANAATLAAASPYFKSLLESGFREGTTVFEERTESTSAEVNSIDFDDSDDEGLQPLEEALGRTPAASSSPAVDTCTHPIHHVKITQSSYITYLAVLCWISTGYIDWAPLSSSFSDTTTRANAISTTQKLNSLPIPSSPKSIYRLAHFLELTELKKLALQAIKAQLTVENIMDELFSETSRTFDDVTDLLVEFVREHRKELSLKSDPKWREMADRVVGLQWGGRVAWKLVAAMGDS
ncbi:hypothetical protein P7C70_g3418, partial [Phenoliferia sp. Uapishka_3]